MNTINIPYANIAFDIFRELCFLFHETFGAVFADGTRVRLPAWAVKLVFLNHSFRRSAPYRGVEDEDG